MVQRIWIVHLPETFQQARNSQKVNSFSITSTAMDMATHNHHVKDADTLDVEVVRDKV